MYGLGRKIYLQAFVLITALLIMAGCNTLDAPADLATQARPERGLINVSDDLVLGICGDFPLRLQAEGTIRITEFFDRHGNFIRDQWHFNISGSYTNEDNGKFVLVNFHYTDAIHEAEGTFTLVGMTRQVRLPDGGVLGVGAGKLVFDLETNEVLFKAGPKPFLADEFAPVCEALR